MIGLDELSSSARMSRYETGIHEPPFVVAERLAEVLEVPVAFFYCESEDMAGLVVGFSKLPSRLQAKVLQNLSDLAKEAD